MESVKSINKSASSSGHTTEQKPVYDFLNLKIILKTITSVFKGEGAV